MSKRKKRRQAGACYRADLEDGFTPLKGRAGLGVWLRIRYAECGLACIAAHDAGDFAMGMFFNGQAYLAWMLMQVMRVKQ